MINSQSHLTFTQMLEVLKTSQGVLIPLHIRPDGDSLGAASTLHFMCQNLGIKSKIISHDQIAKYITKNLNIKHIEVEFDYENENLSEYDTLLIADMASKEMISPDIDWITKNEFKLLVIDHHEVDKEWGMLNIVDAHTISACSIIYTLLNEKGLLTANMLPYLAFGILTDSGTFSYPDTKASDFRIMANIIEKGVNISKFINNLREESYEDKLYKGIVYNNLKIIPELKCAYSIITLKEMDELKLDHTQSFISAAHTIRNIIGIEKCFSLTEDASSETTQYNLSMRSMPEYDVAKIAKILGGGGHKNAAGAEIRANSIEEAIEKVKQAIVQAESE